MPSISSPYIFSWDHRRGGGVALCRGQTLSAGGAGYHRTATAARTITSSWLQKSPLDLRAEQQNIWPMAGCLATGRPSTTWGARAPRHSYPPFKFPMFVCRLLKKEN